MLTVQHPHVFDMDVFYERHLAGVLAYTTHGDAVGAVAVHVSDNEICVVGFGREAIIAYVYPGSLDVDVGDIEGVEKVAVLWGSFCGVG